MYDIHFFPNIERKSEEKRERKKRKKNQELVAPPFFLHFLNSAVSNWKKKKTKNGEKREILRKFCMHSKIVLISFPIFFFFFFSCLHRTQEEMKYFCKQDTESFIYLFFNIQVSRRITIFSESFNYYVYACNGIALSPPSLNRMVFWYLPDGSWKPPVGSNFSRYSSSFVYHEMTFFCFSLFSSCSRIFSVNTHSLFVSSVNFLHFGSTKSEKSIFQKFYIPLLRFFRNTRNVRC